MLFFVFFNAAIFIKCYKSFTRRKDTMNFLVDYVFYLKRWVTRFSIDTSKRNLHFSWTTFSILSTHKIKNQHLRKKNLHNFKSINYYYAKLFSFLWFFNHWPLSIWVNVKKIVDEKKLSTIKSLISYKWEENLSFICIFSC